MKSIIKQRVIWGLLGLCLVIGLLSPISVMALNIDDVSYYAKIGSKYVTQEDFENALKNDETVHDVFGDGTVVYYFLLDTLIFDGATISVDDNIHVPDGHIYIENGSNVSSTSVNNQAIRAAGSVHISDSVVTTYHSNGFSSLYGGTGVYINNSTVSTVDGYMSTGQDCTISNGSKVTTMALHTNGLTVSDSTVITPEYMAASIYSYGGNVTMTNSNIEIVSIRDWDNEYYHPAIQLGEGTHLISDCTVKIHGDGIDLYGYSSGSSSLTIQNSTVEIEDAISAININNNTADGEYLLKIIDSNIDITTAPRDETELYGSGYALYATTAIIENSNINIYSETYRCVEILNYMRIVDSVVNINHTKAATAIYVFSTNYTGNQLQISGSEMTVISPNSTSMWVKDSIGIYNSSTVVCESNERTMYCAGGIFVDETQNLLVGSSASTATEYDDISGLNTMGWRIADYEYIKFYQGTPTAENYDIMLSSELEVVVGEDVVPNVQTTPSGESYVLISSDTEIVTVEGSSITGQKVGSTTITAQLTENPDVSATCIVAVVEDEPNYDITMPESLTLKLVVDETSTPAVETYPAGLSYTLTSSDSEIVEVSGDELIAKAVGTTTVTAVLTDHPEIEACCTVTVEKNEYDSVMWAIAASQLSYEDLSFQMIDETVTEFTQTGTLSDRSDKWVYEFDGIEEGVGLSLFYRDVIGDWTLTDGFSDSESGFYAIALDSPDGLTKIIAFRGTGDFNDFLSDAEFAALNTLSGQFNQAMDFYNSCTANYTGEVLLTGHSLGGLWRAMFLCRQETERNYLTQQMDLS